jgi:hypothetical protein
VEPALVSPFAPWESFYVIVGSSAAALTGLQFVVIVLGAELRRGNLRAADAFGTPNVVHFCAALLDSVILSAPWRGVSGAAIAIAALGSVGIVYTPLVLRRALRQDEYAPVLEDWIWHIVLPFVAYAAFLIGGIFLTADPPFWLFLIGAAALLLLLVGIHNAWDSVTYLAIQHNRSDESSSRGAPRERPGAP